VAAVPAPVQDIPISTIPEVTKDVKTDGQHTQDTISLEGKERIWDVQSTKTVNNTKGQKDIFTYLDGQINGFGTLPH